jgi:hypothetical protein
MTGPEVIRAIEQAVAYMLLFHEQKGEDFGGIEEPLDLERFEKAVTGFSHITAALLPAGKKCQYCNGTGIAQKGAKKVKP